MYFMLGAAAHFHFLVLVKFHHVLLEFNSMSVVDEDALEGTFLVGVIHCIATCWITFEACGWWLVM